MFIPRIFILLIMTLANLVHAADNIPSKADGYRETAMFDGHQNMPFTIYGVAIDWHLDCLKGDADKCMRIGEAMEVGEGDLTAEIRAALGYYLAACEKGEGAGCAKAALIIRNGNANFIDEKLAQETALRGCDQLGDQDACVIKAIGLSPGADLMANLDAAEMIENACHQGSDYGCQIKAMSLFQDKSDEKKRSAAVRMFEEACGENLAWGCAGLADAYSNGIGVTADKAQAMEAARRGCLESDGNTISSCSKYGYLLTQGGPDGNMNLGVALLAKACLADDAFACNEAGEIGWKRPLGTGIPTWEVPLYFRDGCDLNNANACANLATLYEEGYGSLKEHKGVMVQLLDKACELGSDETCQKIEALGRVVEIMRKRPPKVDVSLTTDQQLAVVAGLAEQGKYGVARNAIIRLMNEGSAEANWLLGGWLYYGYRGIINEPNEEDGFILFENAARQGHVEAAKWVAMAYWYGDGVEMDRDKGLGYMRIAAARGDEMAKGIYQSMLAEPIREAKRIRQKEMEEEAERRKNDWGYQISLARSRWLQAQQGASYGTGNNAAAAASWQRSQQALDKLNWNNAVGYATGRTTACPISNPYC